MPLAALCRTLAVAVALGLCLGAAGVTVDFYTSKGPAGSATGLNLCHALIADGADGDRNGPQDYFSPTSSYYGDGVPDGVQVGVLEYLYATPGAPYHALAVQAFEQNRQALIDWNGGICAYPDGDGPGSTEDAPRYGPRFAFADFPYCDLYGSGLDVPICFPICTPSTALLLELAAYICVSEHVQHANSKWHLLVYLQEATPSTIQVDFDAHPGFNRAAAPVLGILGDIDGDGLTNLAEYESVARAFIAARPALAGATPETLWDRLGRADKDAFIGRYLDIAVFTQGPDPADPAPPSFGIPRQSSGMWVEEGAGEQFTLFVDPEHGLAPLTFQWYRNGTPLADGPGIAGTGTSHLRIGPPLSFADTGIYSCRIVDADDRVAASQPIEVAVFAAGSLPAASATALMLVAGALALAAARRRR